MSASSSPTAGRRPSVLLVMPAGPGRRSAAESLQAIHDSIARQDAGDLRFLAHKLKSGCANLGAIGMAGFSRDLEELGRADALTFMSGQTLHNFLALVPPEAAQDALDRCLVAVIGPVTEAAATQRRVRVDVVAKRATAEAPVEALAQAL